MKSHYPNMAIPLKKRPHWTDVLGGILALVLMLICYAGFLAVFQ